MKPRRLLRKQGPPTARVRDAQTLVGVLVLVGLIVGLRSTLHAGLYRGHDSPGDKVVVLEGGYRLPAFADEVLSGIPEDKPFTFFAPTDAMIEKLQTQLAQAVGEEQAEEILSEVLLHHVIMSKKVKSHEVPQHGNGMHIKAVSGYTLALRRHRDTLSVDNISVRKADLKYGEGIVHIIAEPLLPPSASDVLQAWQTEREKAEAARENEAHEEEEEREEGDVDEAEPGDEEQPSDGKKRAAKKSKRMKKAELLKAKSLESQAQAQLTQQRIKAEQEEAKHALESLNSLLQAKEKERNTHGPAPVAPKAKVVVRERSEEEDEEEEDDEEEEEEEEDEAELRPVGSKAKVSQKAQSQDKAEEDEEEEDDEEGREQDTDEEGGEEEESEEGREEEEESEEGREEDEEEGEGEGEGGEEEGDEEGSEPQDEAAESEAEDASKQGRGGKRHAKDDKQGPLGEADESIEVAWGEDDQASEEAADPHTTAGLTHHRLHAPPPVKTTTGGKSKSSSGKKASKQKQQEQKQQAEEDLGSEEDHEDDPQTSGFDTIGEVVEEEEEEGKKGKKREGKEKDASLIVHRMYGDVNELQADVETALMCSGHGMPDTNELCRCSVLYTGSQCEGSKTVPLSPLFSGFNGSMVFGRVRLSQEAARLSEDLDSVPVNVVTPAETYTIIEELTPKLFKSLWADLPTRPVLQGVLYKTCAVVGHSGSLLRYETGDEIDAHDAIIRLERAPTRGYEEHVGVKTSFRVMSVENAGFHEGRERSIYDVHTEAQFEGLMAFKHHFADEPIHFLSPEFVSYVSHTVGTYPSIDFLAINIALQVCEEVTLYGYFAAERQGARYHYYDMEKAEGASVDAAEWAQTQALVDAGMVSMNEACSVECHSSLAKCSKCLKISVPDLFKMNELNFEQQRMNKERDAQWEAFQEWKSAKKPEHKKSEHQIHHHGASNKGKQKEEKAKETEEKAATDLQAGWEYLITMGQIEDLPEESLIKYYEKYQIHPIPSTKLELVQGIVHHNEKRKASQAQHIAR